MCVCVLALLRECDYVFVCEVRFEFLVIIVDIDFSYVVLYFIKANGSYFFLPAFRKKVQLCLPNTMRIGVLGSALVRACCSFSVCAIRLQGFLPYHGVALFDWLGVKHQQRFGLFFKCKIH